MRGPQLYLFLVVFLGKKEFVLEQLGSGRSIFAIVEALADEVTKRVAFDQV